MGAMLENGSLILVQKISIFKKATLTLCSCATSSQCIAGYYRVFPISSLNRTKQSEKPNIFNEFVHLTSLRSKSSK